MDNSLQNHWNKIYETKQPNEVSWTQDIPITSLNFINSFNLSKDAKIIDIGGGDSKLVDFLLEDGYENLTVLDISEKAIQRAKIRLGKKADKIKWIISDINDFEPQQNYTVWHDRAAFHFLTTPEQVTRYISTAKKAVTNFLTIGTFSDSGPKKCSGLDIKQYSEILLQAELSSAFEKIKCITEDHKTIIFNPYGDLNHFLFCSFKKQN